MTVVAAVGALALPASASADWPVYGHDLANTRDASNEGPAPDQVPSLKEAWSFDSPTGDFTGTPVVAGGVLVAGDHGGHVYALDAVTGKVRWSKDAGAPVNGSAAIDLDAPGGPTAFVPVAAIGAPRLLAFSLSDGTKRWETTLTDQPGSSVYGSPVFWNGAIYIGTSGPNNDDSRARGSLVSLDEASGALRWQSFTVPPGHDGAAVWTTPAIDTSTGRLYVGTGNNYHEPTTDTEDAIIVFDAASGQMLGHFQATSGDSFSTDNLTSGPDHDFGASPNLLTGPDGRALVGEGQKSGVYWALDRATMEPVWHTAVGPGGYLGGVLGSTAYDGHRIFGADTITGQVFALAPDGTQQWQSADSGGAHLSPAAVAHDVVYTVDPGGSLMARDPSTGNVLANLSLGGASFGGVSAAGGAVYVSVGTGPPPEPAPQSDSPGSIVAFGDTSRSGGTVASRARPAIRLAVSPRRVHAGRRTTIRVRAKAGARPVGGVLIRLAGRHARTGTRGRARLTVRFRRAGIRRLRATKRGLAGASVTIRVVRR